MIRLEQQSFSVGKERERPQFMVHSELNIVFRPAADNEEPSWWCPPGSSWVHHTLTLSPTHSSTHSQSHAYLHLFYSRINLHLHRFSAIYTPSSSLYLSLSISHARTHTHTHTVSPVCSALVSACSYQARKVVSHGDQRLNRKYKKEDRFKEQAHSKHKA